MGQAPLSAGQLVENEGRKEGPPCSHTPAASSFSGEIAPNGAFILKGFPTPHKGSADPFFPNLVDDGMRAIIALAEHLLNDRHHGSV